MPHSNFVWLSIYLCSFPQNTAFFKGAQGAAAWSWNILLRWNMLKYTWGNIETAKLQFTPLPSAKCGSHLLICHQECRLNQQAVLSCSNMKIYDIKVRRGKRHRKTKLNRTKWRTNANIKFEMESKFPSPPERQKRVLKFFFQMLLNFVTWDSVQPQAPDSWSHIRILWDTKTSVLR